MYPNAAWTSAGRTLAVGEARCDEPERRDDRHADERRPDPLDRLGQQDPGERDEDREDERHDEEHRADGRPVHARPVGPEGMARVAAAEHESRRSRAGRRRPMIVAVTSCQSGRGVAWPSLASVVGEHAAEAGQVLRVTLLQVDDAEVRDRALDDRGAEHVGQDHRRDGGLEPVRAVQGVAILGEQERLDARARCPPGSPTP